MTTKESPPMSATRSLVTGLVRLGVLVLLWGAILFGINGGFDWTLAWAFIGVYVVIAVITQIAIGPDLRAERATAITKETSPVERVVTVISGVGQFGTLIVAALDRRFWQAAPVMSNGVQWTGLVLVAVGLLIGVWAMLANKFYSSAVRIQEDRGQTVVTTGPYGIVRHPSYVGFILLALATPLALGSLWALIPAVVLAGAVVVRTADEDRTLRRDLPGYEDYTQRTRYRLLPGLW
jgi:protein-S-isoprenylcysteine O-methyltransferase Ste14